MSPPAGGSVVHGRLGGVEDLGGPSNRSFGLTVGGILLGLGLLRLVLVLPDRPGAFTVVLLAAGLGLCAAALWAAGWLTRPNRAWMALGRLLARVANPVILLLVFAVAFVPIGLVLRWRGHDPLRARPGAPGASHWVEPDRATPLAAGMGNQF